MSKPAVLHKNLKALSLRHPEIAQKVKACGALAGLKIMVSRKGPPVPVLLKDGRPYHLHSRFDPVIEGARLAQSISGEFAVVFGLGGGYHIAPLLERPSLKGLILVEENLPLLRGILEQMDLSSIFADPRVDFLLDPSPQQTRQAVLDTFIPVLYSGLESLVLRSRKEMNARWFLGQLEALRQLPETLSRDYTVQRSFGKRWHMNTLANLPRSEQSCRLPAASRRMLITAAGPSLEQKVERIRELQSGGALLLATDTSLPFLLSAAIKPDWVISIDCQIISYHHFFRRLPEETTLILDLASPPVLARQTERLCFFTGGHPLSLYLNSVHRALPLLDVSGGSVTHAALSLAGLAGAETVHLFGADFAYLQGRPYARGTYLYPHFFSRSELTRPGENDFWRFIHRSPLQTERIHGIRKQRTSVMDHYRQALEEATEAFNFHLVHEEGPAAPPCPAGSSKKRAAAAPIAPGPVIRPWQEVLNDYLSRIAALPSFNGSPGEYIRALSPRDRQVWATLLPAAAGFRNETNDGCRAVEQARSWVLGRGGPR